MQQPYDALTAIEYTLVHALHALDQKRYIDFAQHFSTGAALFRPTSDTPLLGHDAIIQAYQGNPPQRINRHILSNLSVTLTDDNSASALSYVTLYSADVTETDDGEPEDKPVFGYRVQRVLVGEFHDQLAYIDQQWKITERRALFTHNASQGA